MCGQLNDQVVTHATGALKKLAYRHEGQVTMAVGARAAAQLEGAGRTVEASMDVPGSIGGITAAVEDLLKKIDEWHFSRGIEFVVLFNARPSRARGIASAAYGCCRSTSNGSTD